MQIRRCYPASCLSLSCGAVRTDPGCVQCPNRPRLDEFLRWVEESGAIVADDIWSPNIYVATVPDA